MLAEMIMWSALMCIIFLYGFLNNNTNLMVCLRWWIGGLAAITVMELFVLAGSAAAVGLG